MSKKLRVTMPDGSEWDVPAEIIAKNKAEHYYNEGDEDFKEEYEFTLSDNEELIDWAENNMNWEDVKQYALQIKGPGELDYQKGWVNGDKEVVEC